jgi:nitrate/nitrite transporter NarK
VAALFAYLTANAATVEMAVFYQTVGYFFSTVAGCSLYTIPNATLPSRVVGSAIGLINSAGQLAGFLSPLIVGYILTKTNNNFGTVFNLFVGCFAVASISAWRIRVREHGGDNEVKAAPVQMGSTDRLK